VENIKQELLRLTGRKNRPDHLNVHMNVSDKNMATVMESMEKHFEDTQRNIFYNTWVNAQKNLRLG